MPSGVTDLVNKVFDGCSSITSLTIPSGLTGALDLGKMEGLETLDITNVQFSSINLTYSKLTSITLPNSIT